MRLEYTDGSQRELLSDESWKLTTQGPIRTNNEYDGEDYDARMDLGRWSEAGLRRLGLAAGAAGDRARRLPGRPRCSEPIRVVETLRPKGPHPRAPARRVRVRHGPEHGRLVPGKALRPPAGTAVTLRHAETLKADGTLYRDNLRSAKATDVVVLRGAGQEVYEPRFTYHGFRYVELTGLPGKADLGMLEGCVVHDGVASAGTFECSSALVNRIHDNIRWGVRGNYRSISTDCPQRDERQGWLGDRSCVSRGESYQFDIAALYAKWLTDMHDAQRENGSVSDVCPSYWPIYSDNVVWPSTFVIAPGMLYEQYGDLRPAARQYEGMARWIELIGQSLKDGLLPKERDRYGDWCVPPESPELIHSKDPARQTSKELLATSYYYYDVLQMARYAGLLGRADDARRYTALRPARSRRPSTPGSSTPGRRSTTTGHRRPACFRWRSGWCRAEHRKAVFQRLVDNILQNTRGHIGTRASSAASGCCACSPITAGPTWPGPWPRRKPIRAGATWSPREPPRSGSCGTATRPIRR